MKLKHLPASATAEQIVETLKSDGVLVVDNLVPAAAMDALAAEVAPYMAKTPTGPDEFTGRRTRRTGGLVARSPKARDLIMHPLMLDAAGKLLSHATSFQLHLTQVISVGPGEPAQAIHRDQWAFDFFPFPAGYDPVFNTIWAMTDFTEENGATRVIPGSNLAADRLEYKHEDTVPAEMSKGSVLVYNGSVYHGAGSNRSNAPRSGVNITYALSWLRQEENQYLTVPVEIARTLPLELLKLIGYQRGAYSLGYLDDLRDPMEHVHPDAGRAGFGDLQALQDKLRSEGTTFTSIGQA